MISATKPGTLPAFPVVGNWSDSAICALADLLLDAAEAEVRREAGGGDTSELDESERQGRRNEGHEQ